MDAYVVSLRESRYERVAARLAELGLRVQRAAGVLVDTYPGKCLNAGEYGCTLAHYDVLRRLQEPSIICEDDVEIRKELQELPDLGGYPMVLLGSTQYHWTGVTIEADHYRANHKSNGTFAYYITPGIAHTVARRIDTGHIDAMDRLYKRYVYAEHYVPVLYPNLAIANVGDSDIRGPRDRRHHARRTRWVLEDYGV